MGRKKKGYVRETRAGRFEAEVAGEYLGAFDTKGHAERMVKAAINEDSGVIPSAFSVYASDWMDKRELAARKRKRSSAFDKERSRWRAHVETAAFWHLPLRELAKRPEVIQQWVGELCEKEAVQIIKRKTGVERRPTGRTLGKRVVEDSLSLVKLCLDSAQRLGKFRGDNPARLAKLPRFEDREVDMEGDLVVHMWLEEIVALFKLALPPKQRAIFAVAIYCGLRPEELWGLQWQDCRLDGPKPVLRIRRTSRGPLKTKFARRDVPILPFALAALRAWRATQKATPIGTALVWPNPDGKCHGESYTAGWRSKDDAGRHLKGWAERAGVRKEVGFRELRHTCGCHLLQGSWTRRPLSLDEIKRWLGHSSIATTQKHYAALRSDNLYDALDTPADRAVDRPE